MPWLLAFHFSWSSRRSFVSSGRLRLSLLLLFLWGRLERPAAGLSSRSPFDSKSLFCTPGSAGQVDYSTQLSCVGLSLPVKPFLGILVCCLAEGLG